MSDEMWANNEVQFARLLCEISATQDKLDLPALAESMDLDVDHVNELFDRANDVFEESKEKIMSTKKPEDDNEALNKSTVWNCREVQFARLLGVIVKLTDVNAEALANAMSLAPVHVRALFGRAADVKTNALRDLGSQKDAVDYALNFLDRDDAVQALAGITSLLYWDEEGGVWDLDKDISSGADFVMNVGNQFPASIKSAVQAEMQKLKDLKDPGKNALFVTKMSGTEISLEYALNLSKKEYADYVRPPAGTYKHRRSDVIIQIKGHARTNIKSNHPNTKKIEIGDYFDLIEHDLAAASDLIDSKTLSILREKQGTGRWAAYLNMNLSSPNGGHAQFLLVGEGCTFKEPPDQYPVDNEHGMGWQYRYCGMVNMTSGLVEEDAVAEEVGKLRNFRVFWSIDVEAVSEHQAALKALRIQRQDKTVEPEDIETDSAVVFTVSELLPNGDAVGLVEVDLEEGSRCD